MLFVLKHIFHEQFIQDFLKHISTVQLKIINLYCETALV